MFNLARNLAVASLGITLGVATTVWASVKTGV
jgi:hypothetical protein